MPGTDCCERRQAARTGSGKSAPAPWARPRPGFGQSFRDRFKNADHDTHRVACCVRASIFAEFGATGKQNPFRCRRNVVDCARGRGCVQIVIASRSALSCLRNSSLWAGGRLTGKTLPTRAPLRCPDEHHPMTPAAFRRLALSLPRAIESSHMDHPDFRVGGKIFATLGPMKAGGWSSSLPLSKPPSSSPTPTSLKPFPTPGAPQAQTKVHLKPATKAVVTPAVVAAYENLTQGVKRTSRTRSHFAQT